MLEVSYAHEEQGAAEVRTASELSFERPAVLTPAHRILRARWSVHRLPDDDPRAASVPARWPASVVEGPFALCLYRDAASHEVRVLELSPIAAAILEEVAPGHRAVVEAVRAAAEREGFAIDAPFIEAFSELVADLVERGVWLGSRAD
ncbi:MAG: hypothetical protein HYV09_08670 [Deltaproteobacteria bacterium]|nr:hypothetical protein [Deltaproteobacteria bacterium]